MKRVCLFIYLCLPVCRAEAQYAPQAGLAGSTAISASSSEFVAWATHCTVSRGYMNIANTSLGYASIGDSSNATGPANNSIVSLGDSGVAVLTFAKPLYNGSGPDFAVFENGFINAANDSEAFLELAFVEVSSDGINYFRFPASSLTPYDVQKINSDYINASRLDNLAGKYIGSYGTPFDLQQLAGIEQLNINNVTHVRLIDVIGSVSGHSSLDNWGNIINDPYPTPFPSSGFDLDAVGVIHQVETGVNIVGGNVSINIYPNPVIDNIIVSCKGQLQGGLSAILTTITGTVLLQATIDQQIQTIPVAQYPAGMYYLTLQDANGNKWVEKITKQ